MLTLIRICRLISDSATNSLPFPQSFLVCSLFLINVTYLLRRDARNKKLVESRVRVPIMSTQLEFALVIVTAWAQPM